MMPFTVGSKVHVAIAKSGVQLDVDGIVVFAQIGLGMGIAFDPVPESQTALLEAWLGKKAPDEVIAPSFGEAVKELGAKGLDREAVIRLVRLMILKGILSSDEASSIFGEPII
jgi:hypothetical protein